MAPTLDDAPLDVLQFVYGGAGGQAAVARSLATVLQRAELRSGVVLHARPIDLVTDRAAWPGVELIEVVPRSGPFDPRVSRSLERIVRRHPPRALLSHIPYAVGAVRRLGRDGTVAVTTFTEHHSLARRRRRDDARSSRMLSAVSATVLLSDTYLADYPLKERAHRLGTPLHVIPNGVDVALFRPRSAAEEQAAEIRRATGALRIGMASVMGPGKDHATLLRAVAHVRETHPHAHLVLMGDGPTRSELERLCETLGLLGDGRGEGVTFTGMLGVDELADELRSLDLVVQSSAGETQSTAILQAQATGLPVIGTRVSGVSDAIRDGVDGLLVPLGDVEAMADAIRTLADDASRAASFGAAGRSAVEQRFSLERMGQGYLALLDELDPDGPWREAHDRLG
jgi:glycosyltransferase involved in cell wall biosynthesis